MADNSEFLEVTSPATLKNLQAVNAELLKTIASVKDVNANMIGIKTPSGSDSAIKKLTADYDAQALKIAKLQIELEKYTQAQNRTKISNNSLIISNNNVAKSNLSVEQSIERKNKASEREAAKAAILEGVYSKTQQKLNALNLEYRDLAVQKELGVKLSDSEIKRYEYLQARITKYDTTLKAVDATMGKYTRNVGNYASGFNPLGSSIGRIAQELPNLGQSFQIFAMSIGNNIAAFKDAISGIIAQNKALQAEGKATSSVMSQVASSLFSLNTLLYVGIAVFIAYGKEIGDWTKSLFAGEEALDNLTKSQTEFNNARVKGTKASLDERLALNQNLAVAKNDKISMDERLIAVKKIVDQYPFYFKALTTNQILAGDTEKAEDALRKAIEKRAQADKLSEAVVKDKSRIIDLGFQINAQKRLLKAEQDSFDFENTTAAQNASHNKALINYKEKINDLEKERNGLIFENSSREQGIIKLRSESIGLDEKEEKTKKKAIKLKREDAEAINFESDAYEGLLSKLKELREGLVKMRDANVNNNQEFEKFTKLIEYYQTLIDSIEKNQLTESAQKSVAEFKRLYGAMADVTNKTKELSKEQKDFFKQFQEGFFGDAGLPTLFKYLNGDLDEFTKNWQGQFEVITQIAQEAFKFISDASNKNFENEYANLEKQKNISMAFAGDDAAAKEEIQRQYEIRRKQIAEREFKAKKQQALFNIAIDTAQAAVATLARTPLPLGLPFLLTTLALGAAEAALVASQQVPQFWKGTDNAPEGLAWTQEKGREIITDKFGNIKSKGSDKGAKLTYLNKGDKVLNNEKTMDYLMFNDNLNNILTGNNISNPVIEVNNSGISDSQVNKIVNAIENKAEFSQLISNGQLKTVIRKGNTETEVMNRRVNFKGMKV